MRELIIISASRAMVIEPSMNCEMNSLIRLRPRSLEAGSTPKRPCSTIWSSRPFSPANSVVCAVVASVLDCVSAMLCSLDLTLQLVQFYGIPDRIEQQLFELVVALQTAAQICQTLAEVQKLFEGLDLPGHVFGVEIVH